MATDLHTSLGSSRCRRTVFCQFLRQRRLVHWLKLVSGFDSNDIWCLILQPDEASTDSLLHFKRINIWFTIINQRSLATYQPASSSAITLIKHHNYDLYLFSLLFAFVLLSITSNCWWIERLSSSRNRWVNVCQLDLIKTGTAGWYSLIFLTSLRDVCWFIERVRRKIIDCSTCQ